VVGSPIAKTREKLKQRRFPARLQSLTELEDSSAVQAEDAKFEDKRDSSSTQLSMAIGETRDNIDGHAEEQRTGANRGFVPRHRRRTEAPGRTGARTVGGARDQRRFGVTRKFSLAKPEGERTGATREGSSAGAGRCSTGETRALVVGDTEVPLYGATRKRLLGTAEAFNPRVASRVDRR
jgi:hypothetical protein